MSFLQWVKHGLQYNALKATFPLLHPIQTATKAKQKSIQAMQKSARGTKYALWNPKGLALVAGLAISQSIMHANHYHLSIIPSKYPSAERASFQTEFGIKLYGQVADIEKTTALENLTEVLHKEQFIGKLGIHTIELYSGHLAEMPISQQICQTFSSGYTGWKFGDKIGLFVPLNGNIHHECKHARTKQILKTNPEFKKRLIALTNSKSSYLSTPEMICVHVQALEWMVPKRTLTHTEKRNFRNGFVNNYSRRNWYEEAAEIGETVEENDNEEFKEFILKNSTSVLRKKVELAQECGLIDSAYIPYITCTRSVAKNNPRTAIPILESFKKQHETSAYFGEVMNELAQLYWKVGDETKAAESAIAGLQAPFKTKEGYGKNLFFLASRTFDSLSTEDETMYRMAHFQYTKRLKNQATLARRIGVNDILMPENLGRKRRAYVSNE